MPDKVWYADCYCPSDTLPRNSYGPGTLAEVTQVMHNVLSRPLSGISEVRITQMTKGCSPRPLPEAGL